MELCQRGGLKMVHLEEMTELAKGVRITYKPRSLCVQPPADYEVKVDYNVADDEMVGQELDDGWFNYNK